MSAKNRELAEILCGVRPKHITPSDEAVVAAAVAQFMESVPSCEYGSVNVLGFGTYSPILKQHVYETIDKSVDSALEFVHKLRDYGFQVGYSVKFGVKGIDHYVLIEYCIVYRQVTKYVTQKISVLSDNVLWLGD